MAEYIRKNPGLDRYRFMMERASLNGEDFTKEDLDTICPDHELQILESEVHSIWVNSKILEKHGITDDTPDPAPGLAYYVRKDGHVTGNAYESAGWPFVFDWLKENLTDEQIATAVARWIEFSKKEGVSCVFDAGFPEHNDIHERIYSHLRDLDRQGKLPIYIDGCYVLTNRNKCKEAIEETKRFNREFNTEHLKVHTLKVFMDGTMKIETAAMVTPYADTGVVGATTFEAEEIAEILKTLNEEGLDFHVHTVGERSSRVVLDGVEMARKELGDNFRVKVTCAHLWIQDDADLERFKKLGVTANYTPVWHSGTIGGRDSLKKIFKFRFWGAGCQHSLPSRPLFFPRTLTDILRCLTKCLLNRAGSPKIMVLVVLTCNKASIIAILTQCPVRRPHMQPMR
jgi:predicted amidohydrolase YtcJ